MHHKRMIFQDLIEEIKGKLLVPLEFNSTLYSLRTSIISKYAARTHALAPICALKVIHAQAIPAVSQNTNRETSNPTARRVVSFRVRALKRYLFQSDIFVKIYRQTLCMRPSVAFSGHDLLCGRRVSSNWQLLHDCDVPLWQVAWQLRPCDLAAIGSRTHEADVSAFSASQDGASLP